MPGVVALRLLGDPVDRVVGEVDEFGGGEFASLFGRVPHLGERGDEVVHDVDDLLRVSELAAAVKEPKQVIQWVDVNIVPHLTGTTLQ